ncbi:hypothetical protein WICMUC_000092 [Wickerhamomyces mucosus]|uniref:BPL/LPL catalytic domain-containing protein n=1 Tax=Wickerhamomyces mucosus TaxID=1378264 RepID=A0A9P8Q169_9ASCO|nr:hypothetical protein WICMUC_000092 [Wickerhamomyces mucosus]
MNVLVYSGPGTTPDSVKHCLESLRRFLSPYYAVVSVDTRTLAKEPWASKTSLLVLPGGADLPVCKEFNGAVNSTIKDFVKKGGKFLGFCAGGYYGSSKCEFEIGNPIMEVSGPRELKFFPGIARGAAFSGFQYGSEAGAKLAQVEVNKQALELDQEFSYHYYNGGSTFVDADKYDNVEVLARYTDQLSVDSGSIAAAVVYCKVGEGGAILTGTHPEYVPELMKKDLGNSQYNELIGNLLQTNESRQHFLRALLVKLGLKVNDNELVRPRLTPLTLSSPIPGNISNILDQLLANVGLSGDDHNLLVGNQDTFRLHKGEDTQNSHQLDKQEEFEDPDTVIKELYVYTDSLPDRKSTSFFDIPTYFRLLQENYGSLYRANAGSTLLYGEVVTSTSSMLDKNFNILTNLPSGLVCAASVQVSGRGRGGNIWINPPGVLASSLVLDLPTNYTHAPVVFVQYLTSLAVVEAVKNFGQGYEELPIKIKWPNDIYAIKPEYFGREIHKDDIEPSYVKISGILVNTNVIENKYKIIVGTGINLFNAAPTTSINSTIELLNTLRNKRGESSLPLITQEELLAKYMFYMGKLFEQFKSLGFGSLLPLYYKHWFHTDQIVRLQDHGLIKAKITGITEDFGLLKAEAIDFYNRPTGQKYLLQPDGNSFDMFKGLISRKQV